MRRGLSALIATVILISATVLGGLLVYQYFQNSFSRMKDLSQSVLVMGSVMELNVNTSIVKVTVTNNHDSTIRVENVTLLDGYGKAMSYTVIDGPVLPIEVPPGEKITLMAKVGGRPAAVYASYTVDGRLYHSEIAQLPR